MQNRSAIWAFTILLIIACLYQLSFTFVSSSVEKKALEYANSKLDSFLITEPGLDLFKQDSIKESYTNEYLLGQTAEKVYPILGYTYRKVKKHEINLGLDLQGGMNVILEVSVLDLIKALSGFNQDPLFLKSLDDTKELAKSSTDNLVTLFGKAYATNNPNGKLAAIFHNRENQDKFPREATNEEILKIIREEAEDAVKRTEQVLRKRIDNLGVVQPNIQRLSGGDRIIVELPGIKDKSRVRKILQGTAKLEFWETFDNAEIYFAIEKANDLLKSDKKSTSDTSDATVAPEAKSAEELLFSDEPTIDSSATDTAADPLAELGLTDTTKADSAVTDPNQSFEDFARENPLFGLLRPNIAQDPQSGQYFPAKGSAIGFANIKDVEKVNALLERKDIKKLFPPRIKFLWAAKPYDDREEFLQLFAIKVTSREGIAPLEGDAVINATVETDAMGNPEVTLIMNATGAQKWRLLTKENVGKSIAIVLDGFVYSAPNVQSEIKGGRSSISGRFTMEEADDLSNILKAGKLPAPSNIIEEAVVGPSLGKEAISSGLSSFVIALIVVLLYMFFYYSTSGIVADIALFFNLFFIMGVLTSLGATLTLPGIAGIVLTIGMSVDANVLIFERIREEVTAGKGLRLAIADGYNNAYSAIIDANITTLLTAIILNVFGTGPIKGFATTLIIGILTSLFCAIFITRLIFEYLLDKKKEVKFSTKFTENAFKNVNIPFVQKRKSFYAISGIIILLGLASFAIRGFNYGVDFTGGRSYLVRFEQPADVEKIGSVLENVFVGTDGLKMRPEVKVYGSSNQVKITTKYMIGETGMEIDDQVESVLDGGLNQLGSSFEIMSSQKVEPTIAEDIKESAFWAVLFSLIIIFLYIFFRFKGFQYGVGALVAMVHDVLIVLAVFSMFYGILPFSLEIDQAFIAAILTVVGYSINDTVVVFDRIREFLHLHKKRDFSLVVNEALNSTLSRTINTSLSTFFVLLMIFIFGGEVIRGFVFALMIGVAVGTYSSLFVAAPIILDLDKKNNLKE
jgi:SecD/SecF fusion protein